MYQNKTICVVVPAYNEAIQIGSDVGGIRDIIIDSETGLLFEQKNPDSLAEKIIQLLSDEQLRKKVIENGFKLVKEKFTWEAISDRFLNIYIEVIKKD